MTWLDGFLPLAEWALRQQDLRHRYVFSKSAAHVMDSPGIAWTLEAMVVLAIYEAALGKGLIDGKTVGYEKPYPRPTRSKKQNPKRSDLAFKDSGVGKNWAYIEVKAYGANGRSAVDADIQKLENIEKRVQRWVFVYRTHRSDNKSQPLEKLLLKNFEGRISVHGGGKFETIAGKAGRPAICEFCLARVR